MASILIVDDDRAFREGLAETLTDLGHRVHAAGSGEEALGCLGERTMDLIFLDLRLPELDGLGVLRRLKSDPRSAGTPVIILTAYAGSGNTIEAMKLGAFDHLTKPVGREDVRHIVARALARLQAHAQTAVLRGTDEDRLIGASRPMRELQKLIGLAAAGDVPVLITGETGTGKELVARTLHHYGGRVSRPFVAVNCAAIPIDLLESELFGHVRGAFTGAVAEHIGRVREAEGGMLLLDEIGDMSLPMQAKLLRVIQEREVTPVGSSKSQRVDIRVLAATHRDLPTLVKEGRFREDLFYRLNVLHLHIPPLRERRADILPLAEHFLYQADPGGPKLLSAAAVKALLDYHWPGNARELENMMRRLTVLVRGPIIDATDLTFAATEAGAGLDMTDLRRMDLPAAVRCLEIQLIQQALDAAKGNRAEAARRLGIHRQLLYAKLKEYGIEDRGSSE